MVQTAGRHGAIVGVFLLAIICGVDGARNDDVHCLGNVPAIVVQVGGAVPGPDGATALAHHGIP